MLIILQNVFACKWQTSFFKYSSSSILNTVVLSCLYPCPDFEGFNIPFNFVADYFLFNHVPTVVIFSLPTQDQITVIFSILIIFFKEVWWSSARPGFESRPGASPPCGLRGGRSHCNTVQIKYKTLGLGGLLI